MGDMFIPYSCGFCPLLLPSSIMLNRDDTSPLLAVAFFFLLLLLFAMGQVLRLPSLLCSTSGQVSRLVSVFDFTLGVARLLGEAKRAWAGLRLSAPFPLTWFPLSSSLCVLFPFSFPVHLKFLD